MNKLFSFLFFLLLLNILSSQTETTWNKLEINTPLYPDYIDIVELCGRLYLNIEGQVFVSENQGETWDLLIDVGHYQNVILREDGLVVEDYTQFYFLGDYGITGSSVIKALDCESGNLLPQLNFQTGQTTHGSSSVRVGYILDKFTTSYNVSSLAYVGGDFYSSADGFDWYLEHEGQLESGEGPWDSLYAAETRIVKSATYTTEKYYFVEQDSTGQLVLDGALGAFYENDLIFFLNSEGTFQYKTIEEENWSVIDIGLNEINSFGTYNENYFIATENEVLEVTWNGVNFTIGEHLLDDIELGNHSIVEVEFLQNTFIIKTHQDEVIRFSSAGESLVSAQITTPRNFDKLVSNGDNLYLIEDSPRRTLRIEEDTAIAIFSNFSNVDNPFLIEHFDNYSIAITNEEGEDCETSSASIMKTIDNGATWTTVYSVNDCFTPKIWNSEGNLIIVGNGHLLISGDEGNTWGELENSIYSTKRFAIDGEGRWISTSNNEVRYSENFGITWNSVFTLPYIGETFYWSQENYLFSSGEEIFIVSPIEGSLYRWSMEELMVVEEVAFEGMQSYDIQGFALGEGLGLIQQGFNNRLFISGVNPSQILEIEVPFMYEFRFFFPDYWMTMPYNAPGALSYIEFQNHIFAKANNCIWYAGVCDLWQPDLDQEITICQGTPYEYNGELISNDTILVDTLSIQFGCQQVRTINLDVIEGVQPYADIQWCSNEPYSFFDQEITESGVYHHQAISEEGCIFFQELIIEIEAPYEQLIEVEICEGNLFEMNDSTMLSAGIYSFYLESGNCDTLQILNIEEIPLETETAYVEIEEGDFFNGIQIFLDTTIVYTLAATNPEDCDLIIENIIEITPSAINNVEVDFSVIKVYPNPAKEKLTIELASEIENNGTRNIEIVNVFGQIILEEKMPSSLKVVTLNNLSSGLYFVKISSNKNQKNYLSTFVLE